MTTDVENRTDANRIWCECKGHTKTSTQPELL